ncbi:MAG TPA: serine/threonine-protein kinase [Trichocoleus sp.]
MITTQRRRSHYRLLGLVGHGQFGRVYCAVHRRTGELVALKDLNRDRFSTHKFLRELRFLLSLEHPHIATCQALEHSATGRQLVLDYCEGGTLRYLIENEVPLTLTEVLGFVRDILSALDQAHRQGIVHCDIKPENILLSIAPGGWQAKISDFGIARLSQESSDSDLGHVGSPAYMAPERFYNQHPAAADLYAVGIILYELLTGKRPFSGTPAELMGAHLNQRLVLPETIPAPLKDIISKALQKLLPRRYKTASEMLQAVEAAAERLSPAALSVAISTPQDPPLLAPALPFVTLPHPVEHLGLVSLSAPAKLDQPTSARGEQLLVSCQQQQVWFYHWTSQGQDVVGQTQGFSLPSPVQRFEATPYGGCFFTDHSMHLLSMRYGLAAIARFDHPVAATIAPNGRWFAACSRGNQAQETQLILRRLVIKSNETAKAATITRVNVPLGQGQVITLAALDACHLVMAIQQGEATALTGFTRRGNCIGTLHLPTVVQSLVPTGQPYRFLAQEKNHPNALLIIDLKPFRVSRYRLDIEPRWLFTTAAGYAAASADGQLRLMSASGQIIGRLDRLPRPIDILPLSPTQLLWAASEPAHSRIYTVDLQQLGLDLIF